MPPSLRPVLELIDVHRTFTVNRGLFKGKRDLRAVNGSPSAFKKEMFWDWWGSRAAARPPWPGFFWDCSRPAAANPDRREGDEKEERRTIARKIQPIFQDPYSSLNPRKTIGSIVSLPLRVHRVGDSSTWRGKMEEMLDLVGLPKRVLHSYPGQLSGGSASVWPWPGL